MTAILPAPVLGQGLFEELGTPLREVTFVVVDLETTGGSPHESAITEVGAVKLRGGEVIGEFATLVNPGTHHADVLFKLLLQCGTAGNLANDAHLAALAVEHGASVGTFDHDFLKFKGVQIELLTQPDSSKI